MGKVDRRALPIPPAASAPPGGEAIAPRNAAERSIAAIFAELLNVRTVGIHDDFFDLGGHSLLALQAMSRIRDQLGVDLPPHALFESPTVAGLAALVTGTQGASKEIQRIRPRRQRGPRPASFAQEQLWFLDQLVPGSPAYNIVD